MRSSFSPATHRGGAMVFLPNSAAMWAKSDNVNEPNEPLPMPNVCLHSVVYRNVSEMEYLVIVELLKCHS